MKRLREFCAPLALFVFLISPNPGIATNGDGASATAVPGQETAGSVLSSLEVSSLEARLAAVNASDSYDSVQRSILNNLYSSAIDALKAANADRARAEEFRNVLSGSGEELDSLTAASENIESNPEPPSFRGVSSEELRLRLSSEQSLLSSLRSELEEREAELELLRNERPQQKLAAAQAELAEMVSLTPASSTALEPATFEARSVLESARRLAMRAKINLLDQRRISYDARQALASASANLIKAKIRRSEAIVSYLEAETFQRRAQRADGSLEQTERLAQSLGSLPSSVAQYLDESRRLSRALVNRQAETESISMINEARENDLVRLKKAYATLTEQLRVAGFNISASLAISLRKEREQLSLLVSERALPGTQIQQQIIDARLEEIQLDTELTVDREAAVQRLLAGLSEAESQRLRDFIVKIVSERYRIASDLQTATGDYVAALGRSQSAINNLHIVFTKYRVLVDELLFWVPSAAVLGTDNLQKLLVRVSAELTPTSIRKITGDIGAVLGGYPLQSIAIVVGLLALFLSRPRLLVELKQSGAQVGKVQSDRFRDSVWATVLTVLISLTAPSVLFAASIAVRGTNLYGHLATGLEGAAVACFVFVFFYQLCRPHGLGERHFKWSARSLGLVRRHLRWYIWLVVPCTVVTAATAERYGFLLSDTLGVVAYVVAALATTVLVHSIFNPFRARIPDVAASGGRPTNRRASAIRWLVYIVGTVVPVVLALLALNGFYYTSGQLQGRFFLSATTAGVGVVVFFLAVRLLAISERRLRFKQILEERRVARERQDDQELLAQSGEAIPELLDLGQLDIDTVGAQTRSIARLVVIMGCAAVMWSVWSGLLPAFGVFEDVVLWQVNTGTADSAELENITLLNLLVAFFVVGITVLATRNLPGLVDMIVLSRLDVEPGTNYAITSILNYFIFLSGLLFVCYLLGVQWSKLQWLVAALGVGLGFGLQEIVANFVSGLLILFERPIRVGDTITIGDEIGTVTKIRIRATTVLDWDRKEQIIPNKKFVTEQLTNWTLSDPITRIILRVGVSYNSDVERVHMLLSEVVQSHERVLTNPQPSVFFTGFGDSSLDFELRVFVSRVIDLQPMRHELNVAVFQKLRENGVEIPFPQRDLHLRSSDLNPPVPEL